MATSESTRARRFALPDLADERTSESIEAFLEGPGVRRRPRRKRAAAEAPAVETAAQAPTTSTPTVYQEPAPRPSTELRTLPGRLDWNAALERESARAARYQRPASVAIVELKPERGNLSIEPFLPALAGPISRSLRSDSRATDLVARVASTRFQMLLPETNEEGAERLAERVASNCRRLILTSGAPVTVRVSVACTGFEESLHDAVANALRSIEAA